jgi:hypothetical protein
VECVVHCATPPWRIRASVKYEVLIVNLRSRLSNFLPRHVGNFWNTFLVSGLYLNYSSTTTRALFALLAFLHAHTQSRSRLILKTLCYCVVQISVLQRLWKQLCIVMYYVLCIMYHVLCMYYYVVQISVLQRLWKQLCIVKVKSLTADNMEPTLRSWVTTQALQKVTTPRVA